ncbi:hypothetical protein [Paractinoplanes durhamensis]|uniref:hypothetical protein n=1 Tax=Paractinoplanes durhamensis TaxID=113563 RepID=UPI003630453B
MASSAADESYLVSAVPVSSIATASARSSAVPASANACRNEVSQPVISCRFSATVVSPARSSR